MGLSTLLGYDKRNVPFVWRDIKIVSPFIHQFTLANGAVAFYIKPTANKAIPLETRNDTGYYKGLSAHVVVLVFKRYFSRDCFQESFNYMLKEYPDLCERLMDKIAIIPTQLTSPSRYIEAWFNKHQHCLLETKMWTDEHEKIPDGIYLVRASLAGDRFLYEDRYFFINKEEYLEGTKDGFPFICDPYFHRERVLDNQTTGETKPKPKLALIVNNDRAS